jgi:hypothetical protein
MTTFDLVPIGRLFIHNDVVWVKDSKTTALHMPSLKSVKFTPSQTVQTTL